VIPKNDYLPVQQAKEYFSESARRLITIVPQDMEKFLGWKEIHHFTRAMYLKFLLPTLLAEDRVIYLDCDTIIQGDLGELWHLDLDKNLVAGVIDPQGGSSSEMPLPENDPYINSGVMVMNLKDMRIDRLIDKTVSIYEKFQNLVTWPDQCLINKYSEGKKFVLSEKWNFQIIANSISEEQFKQIKKQRPTVLHFIGHIKPWQQWCNPCISDLWLGYAEKLNAKKSMITSISTIDHALYYSKILDINYRFEESSGIKSNIIDNLLNTIDTYRRQIK